MATQDVLHLNTDLCTSWQHLGDKHIEVHQIKRPYSLTFTCDFDVLNNLDSKTTCSKTWLSFLQSQLQKAMRRKKTELAVSTAREMMLYTGGWTKLVRRLGIIVVEDKVTALDNNYLTLLWLTAVSPQRNLEMERWVLDYVYHLSPCNHSILSESVFQKTAKVQNQSPLSKGLELRSCYGGMKGDVELLKRAAKFCKYCDIIAKPLNRKTTPPKPLDTLLWYAGDFHCFPHITAQLCEQFPEFSAEDVKKAIWYNASGLRKDFENISSHVAVWQKIRSFYKKKSKKCIERAVP
jgi:hypothetical protein